MIEVSEYAYLALCIMKYYVPAEREELARTREELKVTQERLVWERYFRRIPGEPFDVWVAR